MPPDIANGPLQELMTPIFTGSDDVGVVVTIGLTVGVVVSKGVDVDAGVGEGVFSSSLPQAGSRISSNKLKAVNTTKHRFM
jgi:hypothetical protein